jgi:hypothetical protein
VLSLLFQRSASNFDANGNLLTLDNIGTLNWHYNNTLNQLTKADKRVFVAEGLGFVIQLQGVGL